MINSFTMDPLHQTNETLIHSIGDKISENLTVDVDINTHYIVISKDKLTIILEKAKKERTEWAAPLGIFLALVSTLLSSHPHGVIGFSAEDVHAVFVALTFISFCWLIFALYRHIKYRNENNSDNILEEIKQK